MIGLGVIPPAPSCDCTRTTESDGTHRLLLPMSVADVDVLSSVQRDPSLMRMVFEVDARFVAVATLAALARDKQIDPKIVADAIKQFDINPEKVNPAIA